MLNTLYQEMRGRLKDEGIDTPDLDARVLLKSVLGITDADLITGADKEVSESESQTIESFVQRRLAGEPVSRILGRREFWGLDFKITPAVLDPRPDTEVIIEVALKRFKDDPPQNILDLGTGSGCILIALLHEFPKARGVGVDISPEALNVAQENAQAHGVFDRIQFIESSWAEGIDDSFDLIVSNPPYITNQSIANLDAEVRKFDPILALEGGKTGLQAYEYIFKGLNALLNEGGTALFEIGFDQQNDVVRLAEESGLSVIAVYRDSAGNPRVVEISSGDK